MTTKEYFEKRAIETELHSKNRGERYLKELKKSYEMTKEQIKRDIKNFYKKYANELSKIDNIMARQPLKSDEIIKYNEYVKNTVDTASLSDFDKEVMKNKYLADRLSRLESLLRQCEMNMSILTREYENTATDELIENYKNCYSETAHSFFNAPSVFDISFEKVDNNAIKSIVNTKWSNKSFSSRIWGHHRNTVRDIKGVLNVGISLGYSVDKMSKQISKRIDVNYSDAKRLIRTESNYILSEATNKLYNDVNLEEYQYLATLDYKTSYVCQSLDNKVFKAKDRKIGVNCNPMHPNCRSTTIPYLKEYQDEQDTRIAKDSDGKSYYVPANYDYKKWYEDMCGDDKAKYQLARIKHKNRASDKKRYEKYKEVLGGKAPKTLEEYQNIKYNDSEKYELLKLDYKDEVLKANIRDNYNLKIHQGSQDKHIKGTNNYNQELAKGIRKSYLLDDINPQELVDRYAGTGKIQRIQKTGKWTEKQFFEHTDYIGYVFDKYKQEEVLTKRFSIHYSKKKGTHIVPRLEE